jgi:hypothetical protein
VYKKSATDAMSFFVVVYPNRAGAGKPQLAMEFSRDGQLMGSGSPALGEPDAQGRIQYVATVPTAKLEPGNYRIRFVVKQGGEVAEESVTFMLE